MVHKLEKRETERTYCTGLRSRKEVLSSVA